MKSHQGPKCNVNMFTAAVTVTVLLSMSVRVHSGTLLAPPLSPVKVLAAAGVDEPVDKLRYYTFSEEDQVGSGRDGDRAPSRSGSHYSSKDPFEIPSLSAIAEMMRRGKQDGESDERRQFRDRDDHDRVEHRGDTGWGWPGSGSQGDSDRDRGDRWTPRPPLPPPTTSSTGWGWDKGSGREDSFPPPRPAYGKGSYAPVDNKDAFRPWQLETGDRGGWGPPRHTTTERPKYNPKYLASDEDKYRPIRYPPSVTGSGGWSSSGGNRQPSPAWPSKNQNEWDRDRERPSSGPGSGPGSLYLPPHPDPPPPPRDREPPLRDPPKWPSHSSDRDRETGREGWNRPPSRWETERPSNRGWESERRPVPPPPTSSPRPRPRPDESGSRGWSWDKQPTRPTPPQTPPGWGWERGGDRESNRDSPRQPNPFEYKDGVDDLSKHIPPVDVYEKAEYPPGFSRDRPYSKFENSLEDDSFPRAPNHYRIVAYTPSPEEVHKILKQKPTPVSNTYLPPRFSVGGSKSEPDNEGWSDPKCGKRNCNTGSRNNEQAHGQEREILEKDKEKWYKENFQKVAETHPTGTTSRPTTTPPKPEKKTGGTDDPRINQSDSELPPTDGNGKPTPKRPRFDAQGFKYIPYDHPVAKKVTSPPRDIYSNSDSRGGRDSFKRAIQERITAKPETKPETKEESTRVLQGSESRNSFVRRTLNSRSHISLWKSDNLRVSTTEATKTSTRTIRTTTTTTATTPTSTSVTVTGKNGETEKREVEIADFGRKINIIRNKIKREGPFKPAIGPFGPGSSMIRVKKASAPELPTYHQTNATSTSTTEFATNVTSTTEVPLNSFSITPISSLSNSTQCSVPGSKICTTDSGTSTPPSISPVNPIASTVTASNSSSSISN